MLTLLVCQAGAEPFTAYLQPPVVDKGKDIEQPKKKDKDKDKDKDKKLTEAPKTDIFAPMVSSIDFPTYFTPNMMGDWHTIFARQVVTVVGAQNVTITAFNGTTLTSTTGTLSQQRVAIVPVATRGAFNIAENESPRPQDRVFTYWNNYPQLGFGNGGPNGPIATTTTVTTNPPVRVTANFPGAVTTTTTTVIPGVPTVLLNREVFGFEKTFLDGAASIGLRAPLLQQTNGGAGLAADNFGELTIIGKYAPILDRTTGNVLSTGLAITVPSSRSIPTVAGNLQDTYFQPFVGYIWNQGNFFAQGFHSIAVPTDKNDVTIAFNDVGVGYWLYRAGPDRALNFIAPAVEAHLTTPLNHRDLNGPIVVPDTLAITTGIHLGIFRNGILTFGLATPVTGPRPYTVESFVQLNWRF